MRSTLLYVLIAALLLCTVNAYGLTHKKHAKTVREIPIDEHIISMVNKMTPAIANHLQMNIQHLEPQSATVYSKRGDFYTIIATENDKTFKIVLWERPHFNLLDLTYAALQEAN